MTTFDGGMITLGLALGFYWRHLITPQRRVFGLFCIAAISASLLTLLLPDHPFRFFCSLLQTPTIGLAIANADAVRS